jgi:hypothetical protein
MEMDMVNRRIPPATRNELMVIPKNFRIISPDNSTTRRTERTVINTFLLVLVRSMSVIFRQASRKMGIVPTGLTMARRPIKNFMYILMCSMGIS